MKTFHEISKAQVPKRTMSNERRELMLAVINDFLPCVSIMSQLVHYRYCDRFLKWLISNRLTGRDFFEWFKIMFNNSVLHMVQFIVKYQGKNHFLKPIIFNKDWVK